MYTNTVLIKFGDAFFLLQIVNCDMNSIDIKSGTKTLSGITCAEVDESLIRY